MNEIDFLLNFDGDFYELVLLCEYKSSLCSDDFHYELC